MLFEQDNMLSKRHIKLLNLIMLFEQDDKLCKQNIKSFEQHIKSSEQVKK